MSITTFEIFFSNFSDLKNESKKKKKKIKKLSMIQNEFFSLHITLYEVKRLKN